MVETFRKQFVFLLIIVLFAFTFNCVEVLIVPENHLADAQRKRKRKSKKKKKKATKEKKEAGELEQALGQTKDESKIDLSTLVVDNDVALTSAVGVKIDESIAKLMKILNRFQEPGTLRRLSEFYWKKSHRLNLDLMLAHQKKMDVWFEAGQKGDPPAEPDPETWYKYNRKAVEICDLIIEKFPEFQGMDEVYFFMAYNLIAIGRDADATNYYKKLVREFPQSGYVPDSWMAIGDYYFSHNNVYDALPAYEEVLRYQASKVFGFAKYKIGWCYYNLGKYRKAIDTFKSVVAWSQDQQASGKSQITLMDEALKDLVMAFAEDGSVAEAEEYFLKVGGKKYFRMMLIRLADIYTNQGKFKDSIKIHRRLIKDYPDHLSNADFQLKIVEAYANMNDKVNTTKEIIEMVFYAKPASESSWVKANIEDEPERVEEAWENAERMLIKTVVEYHKEASKIKNDATWDKAQKLYEIYLQYFAKSKTFYDVMFNYSQLLFDRKKYEQAGEWYKKVAKYDVKGKHFEIASYAAILSYEKLVHKEIKGWIGDTKKRSRRGDKSYKLATTDAQKKKEAAQREKYAQREMSDATKGFVESCNLYIDNIPKSKYKVDIIYKVAIIYYAHNMFPEAVGRFDLIVKDYPKHRLAEYSANLILDSLNMAQKWRVLNDTVRKYLKNKKLVRKASFRNDLKVLLEKSTFKKVEMTEAEKNWVGAAEEYLAFVKEFRKSKVNDRARYNASVHFVTAGMLEKSIEVQLVFLKEHPKSSLYDDVLFKLGKNYEALAYYRESADRYAQYVKKYPKGEFYSDALFNASVFYASLGDTDKGVALKRKYIEKMKKKDEKETMFFGIAFTYMDAKDYKNAEKQFKAYLKKRKSDVTMPVFDKKTEELKKRGKIKGDANRIFVSHIQLMDIYKREKRQNDIDKTYNTVLALAQCDTEKPLGEAAREIIAEASFVKLKDRFDSYIAYKLEVKNRRLKKSKWNDKISEKMKEKYTLMEGLDKAYENVIALKSPRWSVASLYMMGQTKKYYSLSMFNSEIPYWLDIDQKVIYVDRLQMRAEPIEHKALLFFEKALMTAYKTGVYSYYTKESRGELEGYAPEVYKANNTIGFEPGVESNSYYNAEFVTPDVPDYRPPRPVTPADGGAEGTEGTENAQETQIEEEAA